ncbi:MAG: hypothetical protein A2Y77_01320 [Planctomycetes bacterium RBG_13_62_9]|nr:MAG: hypothetical protein A2Y77_01320 [Planctomycetes bacterium RBG_13_62_9]
MKQQIKWSLLVLAAIVALVAGMERVTLGYEYVVSEPDPDVYDANDSTPNDTTSTHDEYAFASGYANPNGTCTADVGTSAWAKDGDGAAPEAWAEAYWGRSWDWNGPPGTAPGGTLQWSYSGYGYLDAWGHNDVGDGQALSVASASGSTSGSGSEGTGGNAYGSASGYVYDDDLGSASASMGGSPEPSGGDPVENENYGSYEASIDWANYDGDSTSIPSGTSNVYFSGGASCDSYSGAGAGPYQSGAEAFADTSGSTTTSLSADF